jgi:hypothetical protein
VCRFGRGSSKRKINLSKVFAGQCVCIREVDEQIWLVSFMHYDLGFFDQDEGRVEPAPNPFAPQTLLTLSPAGIYHEEMVPAEGIEPPTP